MAFVPENRAPDESDRQMVRELFYTQSMLERGAPIFREMLWVLSGRENEEQHVKLLPDYCYHIFDALRVTFFKSFPAITDTIYIKDKAALAEVKTIEDAKKVVQMDWRNLGRLFAIGTRCIQFAELEAEKGADGAGFNDYTPEKIKEVFILIFGRQWVAENAIKIAGEPPNKIFADALNQFIAKWVGTMAAVQPKFESIVYYWSPAALVEFKEGFAQGLTSFMDVNGQLVGVTNRSDTYAFLLLAWPEIKAMMESSPKKNLTDLREWMLPFMRVGVTTFQDIEQLRNVCAPPAQYGIGLSFQSINSKNPPA